MTNTAEPHRVTARPVPGQSPDHCTATPVIAMRSSPGGSPPDELHWIELTEAGPAFPVEVVR